LFVFLGIIALLFTANPSTSRLLNFDSPLLLGEVRPMDLKPSAEPNNYFINIEINPQGPIEFSEGIVLPIATYNSRPYVISAEILNSDGQCVVRATNFYQDDNARVFLKREACESMGPWTNRLMLVIKSKQASRFALWGSFSNVLDRKQNSITIRPDDTDKKIYYIQGGYAEQLKVKGWDRLRLLNFLWDWQETVSLGLKIIIFFMLLFVALIAVKPKFISHSAWVSSLAFASFAFLGSIYAFVVPPLQAPDEPDHLLSYMHLTGSIKLEQEFLGFAQKNHFERIKFHANEQFTANDTLQPNPLPLASHVSDSDIPSRSPILTMIWKAISPSFQDLPAGTHIFVLRLTNLLIVSMLFAGAVYVMGFGMTNDLKPDLDLQSFVWLFAFCLHPIIFFFTVHVSNYSLTLGFGLLGAALLQAFPRFMPKKSILYSSILGACLMGMFLSSSSGISYFGFWFPFLILFPAYLDDYNFRKPGVYIAPLAMGATLSIVFILSNFEIFNSLSVNLLKDPYFWWQNKLGITLAATICLPLAMYAQLAITRFNSLQTLKPIVRVIHAWSGGLICLLLTVPYFIGPNFLPNIEEGNVSLSSAEYAWKVLSVMSHNLSLGPVDFYLSSSFWGGIGWLESNFDNWFVALSRMLVSIGVFSQFVMTHKSSRLRLMIFNLTVCTSLISMLWGTAFIITKSSINLHGRYLIPYYLLIIAFSACGYVQLIRKIGCKQTKLAFIALLLITGLFHAYGLSHILERYFG
jgi:hypothetical protein